jgi:hypothetical protein
MSLRRSAAALVALAAALATLAALAGTATAGVPSIAKACRSIAVSGRQLRVDITEEHGRPRARCATARAVMRRFLRTDPVYAGPNNEQIRFGARTYSCYASRPDGEGWDYHCNWLADSGGRFVDFGAGRRF